MARFAAEQAASRAKRLQSQLRRAMRDPLDPEAIHDVRVAIRRFTQCLRTFEQFFDRKRARKIRRGLSRAMDECGAARNIDIGIEVLREAGIRDRALLSSLRKERSRRQERLVRRLEQWRKKKRFEGITEIESGDAVPGRWDGSATAAANAYRVLPELAAELFAAGGIAAKSGSSHEDLHGFRLQAKRFRYTVELFLNIYDPVLEHELPLLREVQDKLGAINDCVTTLTLIQGNSRAEKAVHKLLSVREERFRRFWRSHAALHEARWEKFLGGSEAPAKRKHESKELKARRPRRGKQAVKEITGTP